MTIQYAGFDEEIKPLCTKMGIAVRAIPALTSQADFKTPKLHHVDFKSKSDTRNACILLGRRDAGERLNAQQLEKLCREAALSAEIETAKEALHCK